MPVKSYFKSITRYPGYGPQSSFPLGWEVIDCFPSCFNVRSALPAKPKRPCNSPGCPALVTSRFCTQHRKKLQQQYDKQRGSRIERGYTNDWIRYSRNYRHHHPLCVICQRNNIIKPSEHTDHIIPVQGPRDPQFWNEQNHQALCASCHSKKTVKEDGGWGK